ncbi:MAG: hypothetical protein ABI647_06735 [Gemmatimonadota bacterium]
MVGRAEWRASLAEREARLWADFRWHLFVAERAGEVVGVASGSYLGNMNIGMVGYLVASPLARGRRVGPRLRIRLGAAFARDAREAGHRALEAVVGEVRRDNPWLKTLIRRRKVLALDFDYLQPRLHHTKKPVPLVLYYDTARQIRRLTCAFLRRLLYTIWRRVYRIARPLTRLAFRQMLRWLDHHRSIGGLSVDDLPGQTARLR